MCDAGHVDLTVIDPRFWSAYHSHRDAVHILFNGSVWKKGKRISKHYCLLSRRIRKITEMSKHSRMEQNNKPLWLERMKQGPPLLRVSDLSNTMYVFQCLMNLAWQCLLCFVYCHG